VQIFAVFGVQTAIEFAYYAYIVAILYVQRSKEKNYVVSLVCGFLFIDCGRVYILVLFGISVGVCEKYYFAEQRDVLFIDVNVCLCLVWGRRQIT